MILDDHAQAVLTLLDADNTAPALVVLDGFVPVDPVTNKSIPPPYALVYFTILSPTAAEEPESSDLTFNQTRVVVEAICHSIGGNAAAARAVGARARNALLNVRPAVTGRACTPIRHVDNQPPQRDETTGTLVFDQIDVYRFQSAPA